MEPQLYYDSHDYEYINISWAGSTPSGKTGIYTVRANRDGAILGYVRWFGRWRQYAFMPERETVYSAGCLDDIAHFIMLLQASYRAKASNKVVA